MPGALIRQKLQAFRAEPSVGEKTRCGSAHTRAVGNAMEHLLDPAEFGKVSKPVPTSSIDK